MTASLRMALAGACALALVSGCGDGTGDDDAGAGMDAATADGGGPGSDAGSRDDAGSGDDAGSTGDDAGATDDGGSPTDAGTSTDAGAPVDAGTCDPASAGGTSGCEGTGLTCQCCPAGGPTMSCLCTTRCSDDSECTDAERPHCNRPSVGPSGGEGICTPAEYACLWGSICASPDTPIATPKGERPIASLGEGDLVLSLHEGALVPRPLTRVARTAVSDHAVVRVELATGRALEISAGHPTADGRAFSDLRPGDRLDGVEILSVRTVPYAHPFTHDVLPDSDTGTYVAGGVLIGSTLAPEL